MLGRLSIVGFGTAACAAFVYHALDFHYVPPMSTSKSNTKQYVSIPVSASNTLDYSMYEQILSRYVHDGKVQYVPLRKSMMREKQKDSLFIQWLHVLSKVGPNTTPTLFADRDEALKYYMNAYNTLALFGVLYHSFYYKRNHDLISSVMDVQSRLEVVNGFGFFKAPMYTLDGDRAVSLYDLENDVIRARFKDARIHCAINCASIGCPKLQSFVIDVQDLDGLCAAFVNENRHVKVDKANRKIYLSKIFEWYTKDFEVFYEDARDEGSKGEFEKNKLLYFVWTYAKDELKNDIVLGVKQGFEIEWIPYDWNLNKYSVQYSYDANLNNPDYAIQ